MQIFTQTKHIIILALLSIAFSPASAFTNTPPGTNGPYSKEAISKKDYRGTTLHILTHVKPIIGEPVDNHAKNFEKLTGAKVILKHVPFGEIFPEMMYGFKTGIYDVVTPCSDLIPDIAKYLEPLPKELLESKQWLDTMPYHKSIASYDGKVMEVSIDGDRHAFHYRYDILENPEIRRDYKTQFGKELRVPETWKELNETAAFLNGKTINGKKIYGIVEITNKDDLLYANFIKRASAYAKHPDVKGGFYFDLKTMEPLINTPGWVEALNDFVASQQYYPPGGKNFGLADVNSSFGNGNAVFTDNWDDSFISAMEKTSPAYNKVLVGLSPGSEKVWNRDTGKWDHFNQPNRVPYIALGWISGVSAKSKNSKAAFDFLGYMSNPVNHRADLIVGRFGINPFRVSDLDLDFWVNQAGWNPRIAKSYIDSLDLQMKSKTRTFDLRIPGNGRYMSTLNVAITRALRGLDTPQQALDDAAKNWKEITEEWGGIDSQRKIYANIVQMEDSDVLE